MLLAFFKANQRDVEILQQQRDIHLEACRCLRVAHGSMVGLSLFALYVNNPFVFQVLGWGCIGAAVVRVISYLPDRPTVTASYLAFLATEIVAGIFLLI